LTVRSSGQIVRLEAMTRTFFNPQLRVPGPTPIPERVVRAAARPMINHRGPEFAELLSEIVANLQTSLNTKNEILLFAGSGTTGLEAAVVNTLSPGEKALFCTIGSFGDRWADIGNAYGADVVRLKVPSGTALKPDEVARVLGENRDIDKVYVTHNETSTGVTNDIAAIAAVVKREQRLLCVDSVSGAGCLPLNVDDLDLDVVVTGSQKGWMTPPGLTMLSVSPAAYRAAESATIPRWTLDFARQKKFQDKSQTYATPPVSVLYALQEGLRIILEEGVEDVWARHSRVGAMTRAGLEAIGLQLFSEPGYRSDTVTAVANPLGSPEELKALITRWRTEYGLVVAGGQGDLQGKIFRIGHLGMVDERDVFAILAVVEQGLVDVGFLDATGAAVPAAQAVLQPQRAPEPVAVS
jgi:aspartate aminotransferase-like enzyme